MMRQLHVTALMGIALGAALGCGTVTASDDGGGGAGTSGVAGASGGAGTGGGALAGTGGGAGTVGAAGTTGAGGTGGTTGTAGASAGGRGGSGTAGIGSGGRGGSDTGGASAGGRGGNGTGGVSTGGRGGTTGSGTGTGGVASGGRGGTTGTGTGTGGIAAGGRGGGGGSTCPAAGCGPLLIGDLTSIASAGAPGFDATGFRCKAIAVCTAGSAACLYFSADNLGSKQSMEDAFQDGIELPTPVAVKMYLHGGAASQCGNPAVTFKVGDHITLTFDGGRQLPVYLPAFMGTELTLYIASDGSTFNDAALTMPAGRKP